MRLLLAYIFYSFNPRLIIVYFLSSVDAIAIKQNKKRKVMEIQRNEGGESNK